MSRPPHPPARSRLVWICGVATGVVAGGIVAYALTGPVSVISARR